MNDLLQTIDQELMGAVINETVEVAGHKYGLRLLERHEESYARSLFPSDTPVIQAFADQNLPVLSVALRSIDGHPVEDLFQLGDDATEDERKLTTTPEGMTRWRREKVMKWLNSKPGTFVDALWMRYLDLKQQSSARLEKLGPLSERTPSGA